MDEQQPESQSQASLQRALGYLNFSEGRPDPRFQQCLNEAYTSLARPETAQPWTALHEALRRELHRLKEQGEAFRETTQAEAVLTLVFEQLLPEYRRLSRRSALSSE